MQWIYKVLSSSVKRLGREADHLPSSNVNVNYGWKHTFAPQCIFSAWCLIEYKGKESKVVPVLK
jgi:hypothetical protein